MGQCSDNESPILINLRNNSANYHLTSAADGVVFDVNADGVLEQVAWTEPDSENAFLALDRNGNSRIDDGSELFGSATRKSNGEIAPNGFDALIDLDGGPASDGRIDSRDTAYSRLRIWLDRNHNGVSEPDELQTLQGAGIVTIYTEYRESRRIDQNGNAYKYVGRALILEKHQEVPRNIFDVFLQVAR